MNKQFEIYNNLYDNNERKQLIAEMIREYRNMNKLSQKEIAEYIGVNTQTYGAYESGRNEPPAEVLVRLSLFYEIPIDILVQRDNMSKDKMTAKKQLEEYEKQIQELKEQLSNSDPNVQAQLKDFLEGMENLTQAIKEKTMDENK